VKNIVARLQNGLSTLFELPEDWEIVLGNGGSTIFWDALTFGMIRERSQHLVFGEFSSKFAKAAVAAPHLGDPEIIEAEVGGHPVGATASDVDFYALTHNETSTGVAMPVIRPEGTAAADGIVAGWKLCRLLVRHLLPAPLLLRIASVRSRHLAAGCPPDLTCRSPSTTP